MIKVFIFNLLASTLILLSSNDLCAQRSVTESEQLRFDAQVSQDTAALHRLLANDLVYIHSNALVESKADFIRSVGGGGIRYLSMQKVKADPVRQWGKTAVAVGVVAVRGLYQGSEFAMQLRYTSIYRKTGGNWQLCSWQSTRLPQD